MSANPKLLQRVYDVLGALFRDLGKDILRSSDEGGMTDVWELVRRGLGAPAREKEEDVATVEKKLEEDVEMAATEPALDDAEEDEDAQPVASTSSLPLPPPPTPLETSLPTHLRTTPQTRRLLGSAFAFLIRKARSATAGDVEGELDQLFRMMVEDVVQLEEVDDGKRLKGRGAKGRGKGHGKGRGQEEGSSTMLAEGLVWVTVETCSVSIFSLKSRAHSCVLILVFFFCRLPTTSSTPERQRSSGLSSRSSSALNPAPSRSQPRS